MGGRYCPIQHAVSPGDKLDWRGCGFKQGVCGEKDGGKCPGADAWPSVATYLPFERDESGLAAVGARRLRADRCAAGGARAAACRASRVARTTTAYHPAARVGRPAARSDCRARGVRRTALDADDDGGHALSRRSGRAAGARAEHAASATRRWPRTADGPRSAATDQSGHRPAAVRRATTDRAGRAGPRADRRRRARAGRSLVAAESQRRCRLHYPRRRQPGEQRCVPEQQFEFALCRRQRRAARRHDRRHLRAAGRPAGRPRPQRGLASRAQRSLAPNGRSVLQCPAGPGFLRRDARHRHQGGRTGSPHRRIGQAPGSARRNLPLAHAAGRAPAGSGPGTAEMARLQRTS